MAVPPTATEDAVDSASSASSPERRSVRAARQLYKVDTRLSQSTVEHGASQSTGKVPGVTPRVFECCDDTRGCTTSGLPSDLITVGGLKPF